MSARPVRRRLQTAAIVDTNTENAPALAHGLPMAAAKGPVSARSVRPVVKTAASAEPRPGLATTGASGKITAPAAVKVFARPVTRTLQPAAIAGTNTKPVATPARGAVGAPASAQAFPAATTTPAHTMTHASPMAAAEAPASHAQTARVRAASINRATEPASAQRVGPVQVQPVMTV